MINEPGYAFTISQHCKFKFLTEGDIQAFIEAEENQKNKSYLALVMTFLAAKLQGSLSELSQIIAAKTKKSILLTDSDVQTLLEEEKPTYKKEKLKVTYSVALVMTFLVAENKK